MRNLTQSWDPKTGWCCPDCFFTRHWTQHEHTLLADWHTPYPGPPNTHRVAEEMLRERLKAEYLDWSQESLEWQRSRIPKQASLLEEAL